MSQPVSLIVDTLSNQDVYPVTELNCPRIAVFEAPYKSGDCPVWEMLLTLASGYWSATNANGEEYARIAYQSDMSKYSVSVLDRNRDVLVEGKEYELRVYDSGVASSGMCNMNAIGRFMWEDEATATEPN